MSVLFRKLISKPSKRVGKILRFRCCCQSSSDLNGTDRAVGMKSTCDRHCQIRFALLLGAKYAHVFCAGGKRCPAKKHPYPFAMSGGKCVQEMRILIPEAAWKHHNLCGNTVDISIGGWGIHDG
jgi:hypothetical protein